MSLNKQIVIRLILSEALKSSRVDRTVLTEEKGENYTIDEKVGVDMTCATAERKILSPNFNRSIIDLTTAIDPLIIWFYVQTNVRKITWQYSSVNRRD